MICSAAAASRVALLAAVVLAATACGGVKLGAPRCKAEQLRFRGDVVWSEATGQHTTPMPLENVSSTTCALYGYPSIRLLNARGVELPYRYTHDGDQMLPRLDPHPVLVPPGGGAALVINKYRCDVRAQDVAKTMLIGLPGGGGVLRFRYTGRLGGLDYCSDAPSVTVDVTPFLPSLAAAHGQG